MNRRGDVYPESAANVTLWAIVVLALIFAVVVMQGCTIAPAYMEADRATYDAIAPHYTRYVVSDPNLTEGKKDRFLRTVESWRARLAEEEGK